MVLHLLSKKSWNVYNSENVERVRRDEAEAKAREEAEEQHMQDEDAVQRIAILRGEKAPALKNSVEASDETGHRKRRHDEGLPRKRRKLRGEDDTDRDIRFAREDGEAGEKAKEVLLKHDEADAPLQDHAGNISLIAPPDEGAIRKAGKNAEAEAEKAKKKKRDEDQYTMRFSNAAGFNNSMGNKPWYALSKSQSNVDDERAVVLSDVQNKNVWGNDDPRRRDREQSRISTNDPFAAMQQAQRQLKQSESDKDKWKTKRMAEIEEMKRDEERRRRSEKKRRRRHGSEDSLEGFSLDGPPEMRHQRDDGERPHRRHHHRRRSRSRSRDKHR